VRKAPTQHHASKDPVKFSAGNEWQEEKSNGVANHRGWIETLALLHLQFGSGMGTIDTVKYARLSSIGKQERNPEIWDLFMKERMKGLQEAEDDVEDSHITANEKVSNQEMTKESSSLSVDADTDSNNVDTLVQKETAAVDSNGPRSGRQPPQRRSSNNGNHKAARERPKVLLDAVKPLFVPSRAPRGPDGTKGFHAANKRITTLKRKQR